MPAVQSPEAYRELLLPKGSAQAIAAYEALTEAEVRMHALSILENPVFRRVLVDFQEQVVQSIRIASPENGLERQGFMLVAIDTLLGAVIGQAFEARSGTTAGE